MPAMNARPMSAKGVSNLAADRDAATSHDCPIPEGQECPTCRRRVPRAKKESSPKTKVVSLRVPIDDTETFSELLEAAAVNSGQREKGHWQYFTVIRGLVLLLQEPPETT